jgi:hypothetical protein
MVTGFGNMNLREEAREDDALPEAAEIDLAEDLVVDETKPSIEVELPDGGIVINFGKIASSQDDDGDFYENLAELLSEADLAGIAEDLLQGIDADIRSRAEWLRQRAEGLDLLGLKIDGPRSDVAGSSAPLEGMSNVRHPLLLEAVLRFQANARGELLPTDGPVKIRVDDITTSSSATEDRDEENQAEQLETDFNYYLTVTASEYYPDTDRMLLMVGFGGCGFKKVYHCPLRRRPVSESVDAKDLIVSHGATDLQNAPRVTHQIQMLPNVVKRMQIMGAYREVALGSPPMTTPDAVDAKIDEIQGTQAQTTFREADQPRTIYECYCEIDVPGYEHKDEKGEITGLPLPFKVTIDKDARTILEIRRNWKEDDDNHEARRVFVKYPFVPGLGFYDIGLLNILGNTTIAVTAAWREMLDAGMFANFPGFLYAKPAGRQNTNEFRVAPGSGAPVDTNGMPINQAVMPLPYKEAGPGLMALTKDISETGQRVGGTAETSVGEGRADAPVGTTIALIEQATKVLDAVHKRLHQAQGEEFGLLKELFKEDPEAFWRFNKRRGAYNWNVERFKAALENYDLVPAADPNTSSHMMRIMKAVAVKQLQASNPELYNDREVDTRVLKVIGWNNPESLFKPPAPPQEAPKDLVGEAAMIEAQAKLKGVAIDEQKVAVDAVKAKQASEDRAADRASKEKIEVLRLAADVSQNPSAEPVVEEVIDEQGHRVAQPSPKAPAPSLPRSI